MAANNNGKYLKMNYIIASPQTLETVQNSLEQQLARGFRNFINLIMGNKTTMNVNVPPEHFRKRNYFLGKYQQLLEKGKTCNVQVVEVARISGENIHCNNAVYISFQLLTREGVKLFTAAAMAPKERTPACYTMVPIFYNPDDLSVVVLL